MRNRLILFALAAFICTSCFPTRIVTVSPDTGAYTQPYVASVTLPSVRPSSSQTRVAAVSADISQHLDLQAVGAAFSQSSTIQEFENLLNNSSYMLSNLDLNNDGYVDYLRVLESVQGINHVFVIQAVLGDNLYQDVATLTAEVPASGNVYVQIIGDPYIYGPRYIVEPVFVSVPPIYACMRRVGYRPWHSPWYWNHYPSCYRHPAPVFITHYQSYVSTYLGGHRYCHEVRYVETVHYVEYTRVIEVYRRNDYGSLHPENSFSRRVANIPSYAVGGGSSSRAITNARDLQGTTRVSSSTSSHTATTSRPSSSATQRVASGSTTVTSRVSSSGTATTSVTRTPGSSSSRSSSSAARTTSSSSTRSSSSAARSTSSSSSRSSSSAARTTSSSSTRSSSSAARSTSSSSTRSSSSAARTTSSSSSRRSSSGR